MKNQIHPLGETSRQKHLQKDLEHVYFQQPLKHSPNIPRDNQSPTIPPSTSTIPRDSTGKIPPDIEKVSKNSTSTSSSSFASGKRKSKNTKEVKNIEIPINNNSTKKQIISDSESAKNNNKNIKKILPQPPQLPQLQTAETRPLNQKYFISHSTANMSSSNYSNSVDESSPITQVSPAESSNSLRRNGSDKLAKYKKRLEKHRQSSSSTLSSSLSSTQSSFADDFQSDSAAVGAADDSPSSFAINSEGAALAVEKSKRSSSIYVSRLPVTKEEDFTSALPSPVTAPPPPSPHPSSFTDNNAKETTITNNFNFKKQSKGYSFMSALRQIFCCPSLFFAGDTFNQQSQKLDSSSLPTPKIVSTTYDIPTQNSASVNVSTHPPIQTHQQPYPAVLSPSNHPQRQQQKFLLRPLVSEDAGKKCLVLDLDETLIHSSFKPIPHPDFIIPVEIDSVVHSVYVLKRPFVDEFLRRLGPQFEIVIFTASLSKYADPVIDNLDKYRVVKHRLFREACFNHRGSYVKDLSQLGRDLRGVIIIDNAPASYLFHPSNAIPITTWFNDVHDTELIDLLPFLEDLRNVPDVRGVLDGDEDEED